MASKTLEIAKRFWEDYSASPPPDQDISHKLALALSHRLVHFFQVGEFYVFVFNVHTAQFEYLSPGLEKVWGYTAEELTADLFFERLHPEDFKIYVNSEYESGKFLSSLSKDKLYKYKLQSDFRIQKKDGTYTRLLHQAMVFDANEEGKILRSFGVHTDIGYLKMEGKPTLSFIGFDGEPSYIDVQIGEELIPIRKTLTQREKEVLLLIMDGLQNKEIAARLHISKETADKHRKNMLKKADCKNSSELIARAIKNAWI